VSRLAQQSPSAYTLPSGRQSAWCPASPSSCRMLTCRAAGGGVVYLNNVCGLMGTTLCVDTLQRNTVSHGKLQSGAYLINQLTPGRLPGLAVASHPSSRAVPVPAPRRRGRARLPPAAAAPARVASRRLPAARETSWRRAGCGDKGEGGARAGEGAATSRQACGRRPPRQRCMGCVAVWLAGCKRGYSVLA
jgi:hypothetical protein